MSEFILAPRKKLATVRRLSTLAGIRRELARVYERADAAGVVGADAEQIQYYRALTFILATCADVLKDEKLQDIEERLTALEEAQGKPEHPGGKHGT